MTAFLVAILLLALAAAIISFPLIFHAIEPHQVAMEENSEYDAGDALLDAMSELDLAHAVGKLSQSDFESQKQQLGRDYLKAHAGKK